MVLPIEIEYVLLSKNEYLELIDLSNLSFIKLGTEYKILNRNKGRKDSSCKDSIRGCQTTTVAFFNADNNIFILLTNDQFCSHGPKLLYYFASHSEYLSLCSRMLGFGIKSPLLCPCLCQLDLF